MTQTNLNKNFGFKDSKAAAVIVAAAFIFVSIIISYNIHRSQNAFFERAIKISSKSLENTIIANTNININSIGRMAARWETNAGTVESLWREDAKNYVSEVDGVDVMMWIDNNNVIKWVESNHINKAPLEGIGFTTDLEMLKNMELSKESKRPEFTSVSQLSDNTFAIHVLFPVWIENTFNGFIGARFDIKALFSAMIIDGDKSGFVLQANADGHEVYLGKGEFNPDGPSHSFKIHMDADQDGWDFTVYPVEDILSLFQSPLPLIVLISGSLIGLLFFITMNSRIKAKKNANLLSHEIKQRKQIESKLDYMSNHDALTHLPNRGYLNIYLQNKITECQMTQQKIAVMFLNIDDFKQLNDTYDHQLADEVLKTIPSRINETLNKSAMIAHMGGDEFIICITDNLIEQKSLIYAEDLLKSIRAPIVIGKKSIRITASMGICFHPNHGHIVSELITRAEHAMMQGKKLGKDTYTIFDESLETSIALKVGMIKSFNQAIDDAEFEMYFQPRHDIKSGNMVGAEALLRWNQGGKILTPDAFLDIAEESGMIVNICNSAFELAFSQYQELFDGNPTIMLSINVSAKQLSHADFLNDLFAMMDRHQFPSEMLEVELTEQTLIQNYESSLATLNTLNSAGVKIALDDFGTGYSSLSYLKNFPVDVLKIDKSFIQEIHENNSDLALTKAIIAMGKSLNMEVVAEGVENQQQLQILAEEGCQQAQGYWLNRPLKYSDFCQLFNDKPLKADSLI